MTKDSVEGVADQLGGTFKKTVGAVIGDRSLQAEGQVDQVGGSIQQAVGDAIDSVEDGVRPLIDSLRQFARDRPFAAVAVAGVLGLALVNTLRGKQA